MMRIRRSAERGQTQIGWLDSRHTFSFGDYFDPAQVEFRALRVLNEDWVQPGQGFGTHPHRDMEIVTYVLSGSLEHRDSLGTGSLIRPGDLQRMTAGTGVRHSEFNPSATDPVHLVQIWLRPERAGLKPSYEQKAFPEAERQGRLRLVASPTGADGSLTIRQDASLYLTTLGAGAEVAHPLAPGRHAWVQILRGAVDLNGQSVAAGDGVAVSDERVLTFRSTGESEVLVFDLA
jgi:redox-sensitive bicupin YhaK (pirin superfamily)